MNDKALALEAIQRLPDDSSLREIRNRVDFLAGLKEAEESLTRGEGIPHEEVMQQFISWTKTWPAQSSSLRKRSKTSAQ